MKNPYCLLFGAAAALALPVNAIDLFWDPDGNATSDGGAGTWQDAGPGWYDPGGAAPANWTAGDNATFGTSGANYTVDIASGGVTVGGLILDSSGVEDVIFRAAVDGQGVTVSSGGATWDLGGRLLEFLNANNANDTALFMTSGDTLTVTDSSGSGFSVFDAGEKPGGADWGVTGAFLDIQDAMTVRGTIDSVGRFDMVTLAGGSTFTYERNNDGEGLFTNNFELASGQVTFGQRYNRRQTHSGVISGAGGMIADPGNGSNRSLRLRGTNTFTGDITVVSGNDSNATRGDVGIRLQEDGTLGDGTNAIEFQNGKRIETTRTDPYTHSGNVTGTGGFDFLSSSVTLSGSNDYTGETYIRGSSLIVDGANALSPNTNLTFDGSDPFLVLGADFAAGSSDYDAALGTGAGQVQWTAGGGFGAIHADRSVDIGGAGATLSWGDVNFIPDSGNFGIQLGSEESTHTTTLVNGLGLTTGGTTYNLRSENGAASIEGVVSGVVSGPGSLEKRGSGVMQLGNAANSYSGDTLVAEGVLLANPLGSVPDLSKVMVSSGAAFGGSTGALSNADFDNILATAIFNSGGALAFDTSAGNYNYASNLSGDVGVTKVGPNDLTLSGTLSYTGATTIYEGNIIFSGGSLPPGSALTLNDNSFDLGGSALETGGLSSFSDQAEIINTGANATLTFDVPGGTTRNFPGTLGQAGPANADFNVVKRGDGTQVLAEVNHYTGSTTIEAGRMDAPRPETFGLTDGSIAQLGRISHTGGTVELDAFGANPWTETNVTDYLSTVAPTGGKDTYLGLNLDLSTQPTAGTWDPGVLGGDHGYRLNATFNSDIFTWDDAHTYTGGTVLVTGTIVCGADNVFGTGDGPLHLINNDSQSIVDLNGTNQTIGGLSDTGGGGSQTKSLDNSTGSSVVTIDVDAGEYYNYSRNIRENSGTIEFVKNGDGEQVIQRNGAVGALGAVIAVNAGTLGLDQAYSGATGSVTVNGGTFEQDGSTGLSVTVGAAGTFGPGINGDADNDGTADDVDPDATAENTVGTALVFNTVTFDSGSTFDFEIGDWNGGDDLGGTDGVDFDLLDADDLVFGGALNVTIGAPAADFTETTKTIVIMRALNSVTGFAAGSVTIDDSAFPGTGSWAIAQMGNDIELTYTAAGDAYDTWAAANISSGPTGFDDDANGDGLANGLNFIFGGDPDAVDFSVLPTGSESGGDFSFNFDRNDDSEGITTQTFQWSVDLVTWNDVPVGAASSGPDGDGVTVTVVEDGANPDAITVLVPGANALNGKLFGRFLASRP